MNLNLAPEFQIEKWLNSEQPLSLELLRGKVILAIAFQMLCPGCVIKSLPQVKAVQLAFKHTELTVLGLHTVFEHHAAMTEVSLKAFLFEYGINFPVGIDQSSLDANIPKTMAKYKMKGTPTFLLIDKQGFLRKQYFGHITDLQLGSDLTNLLNELPTFNLVS